MFSQGDDTVAIAYTFYGDYDGESYNLSYSEFFTWNDLFSCVAPSMIDECTDFHFKTVYNEFFEKNGHWTEDETYLELDNVRMFRISQESFDLIKVQFKALGLISLGVKKRSATDKETYWKLTPYGDYVMTRLLAIKKKV